MTELEQRVEALEAQVKALRDIFVALVGPDGEIEDLDPFSAAFVKFRKRAEEQKGVLR